MTPRLNYYSFFFAALILSASLLIGAWVFQYGFGYAPCQMCYWQRHAHKAVIVLSAVFCGLFLLRGRALSPFLARLGTRLITLAFLVSTGLALWHVGVEQGFIEALPSCSGGDVDLDAITGGDVLGSLSNKIKPPACSDIPWSLMGISMAGYNALFSALGAVLGGLAGAASKRALVEAKASA